MTLSTVPTLLLLAVVLAVFYRFCTLKNPNQGRGDDLDRIEGDGAPVRDADAGVVAHARSSDGRVGHDHADAPSEPKPAQEGDRASDPPGAAYVCVPSPSGTVGSQGEGTGGTSTPGACRPESGES